MKPKREREGESQRERNGGGKMRGGSDVEPPGATVRF